MNNKSIMDSYLYKRLVKYLEEIRRVELEQLDIDIEQYEAERYSTDFSTIINLVEEALYELPEEDCRF